jgi:hypothetical protein
VPRFELGTYAPNPRAAPPAGNGGTMGRITGRGRIAA